MVSIRDDFDNHDDDIVYMLEKYTLSVITYNKLYIMQGMPKLE